MGKAQVGGDSWISVLCPWMQSMNKHIRQNLCWYANQIWIFVRTAEYLGEKNKPRRKKISNDMMNESWLTNEADEISLAPLNRESDQMWEGPKPQRSRIPNGTTVFPEGMRAAMRNHFNSSVPRRCLPKGLELLISWGSRKQIYDQGCRREVSAQ